MMPTGVAGPSSQPEGVQPDETAALYHYYTHGLDWQMHTKYLYPKY